MITESLFVYSPLKTVSVATQCRATLSAIKISISEPPADQHQLYLAKYRHWMTSKFGSPEQFAAVYSVALRIYPMKVRGSSS